jgi:hypothetical protein
MSLIFEIQVTFGVTISANEDESQEIKKTPTLRYSRKYPIIENRGTYNVGKG